MGNIDYRSPRSTSDSAAVVPMAEAPESEFTHCRGSLTGLVGLSAILSDAVKACSLPTIGFPATPITRSLGTLTSRSPSSTTYHLSMLSASTSIEHHWQPFPHQDTSTFTSTVHTPSVGTSADSSSLHCKRHVPVKHRQTQARVLQLNRTPSSMRRPVVLCHWHRATNTRNLIRTLRPPSRGSSSVSSLSSFWLSFCVAGGRAACPQAT